MSEPPEYDRFDLIEPHLRAVDPRWREELTAKVKASLEATSQIQDMYNHPLYRAGSWFYERTGMLPSLGEYLYMTFSPRLLYREVASYLRREK